MSSAQTPYGDVSGQTWQCPFSGAVLRAFPLPGDTHAPAVLIFPGGGYQHVSPRENAPVARAFNARGFHAFSLEYSVAPPAPLGTKPLSEAAWAVSELRAHAAELRISGEPGAEFVAVCGFSAGGHLAASIGTYWHRPEFFGGTLTADVYRPSALILCYPVILAGAHAHTGSIRNLTDDPAYGQSAYSLEKQITPNCPPTFLWHTANDGGVPVQNSLSFALALRENQVPFELHVFPDGVHGLSLATEETCEGQPQLINPHAAQWVDLCAKWLKGVID